MTVTTTSTRNTATGDGVMTSFVFTFRLQQAADMTVYLASVLQVTGYTVTINSNGVGGTVVFSSAPANLTAILLIREVDYTQDTDLVIEGNLPEQTLEDMADKNMMAVQQVKEIADRSLQFPITSSATGELEDPDGKAAYILRINSTEDGIEFVTAATAFLDSTPNAGLGNVTGPVTSVVEAIPLWNNTNGQVLKAGISPGTSGQVVMSNGSVWSAQTLPAGALLKAANITSSLRALPTSGALSGTYIHFGNWTSTNTLTFAHGTKIYLKGNMTLSHTMTGTAQSNGSTGTSTIGTMAFAGGGPGACVQTYIAAAKAGGGGGACGGNGGNGSSTTAGDFAQGGLAYSAMGFGGSGGSSGVGDGSAGSGKVGGGGGAFIYIECDGVVAINETVAANGAAGTANGADTGGGGGGGAGGQQEWRCSGTFTLAGTKSLTANGAAGGNSTGASGMGGGGGGGQVNVWSGGAQTITGTITVTGGAGGTGGATTQAATAGATGLSTLLASTAPISLF